MSELKSADLVGLSYAQAADLVGAAGMHCRVVKADDTYFKVPGDSRMMFGDRVDLELEDGIVAKAVLS